MKEGVIFRSFAKRLLCSFWETATISGYFSPLAPISLVANYGKHPIPPALDLDVDVKTVAQVLARDYLSNFSSRQNSSLLYQERMRKA